MKLLLAFALVAVAHGCIRSTPEQEKPYVPTDEEIMEGIQEAMKRPAGWGDERSWKLMEKKIKAWDYDGWLEQLGMTTKDFFIQKAASQDGNYASQTAFMDFSGNAYWRNFSFVDERTQMLDGFLPKILMKACEYCGATCKAVNIGTNSERCFDEENLSGEGLMNRDYAACAGWGSTPKRANVFDFGIPVSTVPMKQFWIRKTTTDIVTDVDVNGRKIGIPAPAMQYGQYDTACLQRNWPDVRPSEVIATAEDDTALITQLMNREIDIAMGPYIPLDYTDNATLTAIKDIKRVGEPFHCVKDGLSQLMFRKDADMRLPGMCFWYGVVRTGEYKKMCEEYGGTVKDYCIDFEKYFGEYMKEKPSMKPEAF